MWKVIDMLAKFQAHRAIMFLGLNGDAPLPEDMEWQGTRDQYMLCFAVIIALDLQPVNDLDSLYTSLNGLVKNRLAPAFICRAVSNNIDGIPEALQTCLERQWVTTK
jgi:hypothetical protein